MGRNLLRFPHSGVSRISDFSRIFRTWIFEKTTSIPKGWTPWPAPIPGFSGLSGQRRKRSTNTGVMLMEDMAKGFMCMCVGVGVHACARVYALLSVFRSFFLSLFFFFSLSLSLSLFLFFLFLSLSCDIWPGSFRTWMDGSRKAKTRHRPGLCLPRSTSKLRRGHPSASPFEVGSRPATSGASSPSPGKGRQPLQLLRKDWGGKVRGLRGPRDGPTHQLYNKRLVARTRAGLAYKFPWKLCIAGQPCDPSHQF